MRTETKQSQLVEYDPNGGKVLTIVVNVDQSISVNRNREFEIPVNAKLRQVELSLKEKDEIEQFGRCAELGRNLIHAYRPYSKSLVLFLQANGRVTSRELNVALDTEVRWSDTPHTQPLIEAGDEFEEILIVLLDGRESRFLTSKLGELTEYPEVRNPYPTSHTQAPGNDRQKSQPTFHRKADEREHRYLKTVSEMTETIAVRGSINRIVLAGSDGICKELYALLSNDVRKHVISISVLPVRATFQQVSDIVVKAQFRAERENEVAKVTSLLDSAGARNKAVTGLAATAAALAEGRVHELVYAQGIEPNGALCAKCGGIVVDQPACPNCQTAANPAGDAMDLIISAALSTGAGIEQVRDEAAEKLKASGGIGAFLRY
jgi:peptide subunit release factor 1 (eRF1)